MSTHRRGTVHQFCTACVFTLSSLIAPLVPAQEYKLSEKPPLYGTHWAAVAGKPLAATAGGMIFTQGGNAVDAACAMLAASATMWDSLGWGGETQALIHDPRTGKVIAINALGAAPAGATPENYRSMGLNTPPDYGPLAAVTPGTPGGLLVMLAEYGTMSLEEVLAPAIDMASGYAIETNQAEMIQNSAALLRTWQDSSEVFLPHANKNISNSWEAPLPGEQFVQQDLLNTLNKLVEAEREALADGKSRKNAIMAAYDRFYRGDIAEEIVRATQRAGGLITMEDLDSWQVYVEEPVSTTYKGIEVFKLNTWVQGPVLLQMLNMLEPFDLRSLGYNSTNYIHLLYQVMNLAFADRDFYYGDPYFPPEEPIEGLLSKEYALERVTQVDMGENNPDVRPGNPYEYQAGNNPFLDLLDEWRPLVRPGSQQAAVENGNNIMNFDEGFLAGTTSIITADEEGWMVSMTPSGGWIPAFIAGDTGVGLSQRLQSFNMDERRNPYNVMEPGKRPRATLTPSLALRNGEPYLGFAVQGGDTQDQNLLQFLLNIVEFGMDVQQATEAANFNSYQAHSSFGEHYMEPGRLVVREDLPRLELLNLASKGYRVEINELTSGPINAIMVDSEYGTITGGSSNYGDDYGLAW